MNGHRLAGQAVSAVQDEENPMPSEPSAPDLWFLNSRVIIHRSADEASGVSVMEHLMPFGDSPPRHVHLHEDEIFHLLAGEIRFWVDGVEQILRAGETVIAPSGRPHSFRVTSAAGARCLVITVGGDFEGLVRDVSRPAAGAGLPAPVEPTAEMAEGLAAAGRVRRIELVGPPLAA
jgi:quercetin dioxygenase-like cupin family protein